MPLKLNLRVIIASIVSLAGGYLFAAWLESRTAWNDDISLREAHATGEDLVGLITAEDARSDSTGQTSVAQEDTPAGLQFTVLKNAIPGFAYRNGATGQLHLAETLGGGGAAVDVDGDGQLELVFTDGGDPLTPNSGATDNVRIFRQRSPEQFIEVSDIAGGRWSGYGHGCAAADFDNDGFTDLLLTGYGRPALLRNMGDGTYSDWTQQSGLSSSRWNATAAFGDVDKDGDLDLYLTAYADVPATAPEYECEQGGMPIHCHPHYWDPVPDQIFENLSDGTFQDRSVEWGIADQSEYGLGVIIADVISGGAPEIFVANDGDRNLLYERQSDGGFREIGTESGLAFDSNGQSTGSMGIACADFDGNRQFDLLTTNFIRERNVLFRNLGNGVFVDDSEGSTIDQTSRSLVGWGAVPIDADNDTVMDLFIANGHVSRIPGSDYRQTPLLLEGSAAGKFRIAPEPGEYFRKSWHARGAFSADVAGDERADIIVCHVDDPPSILVNHSDRRGEMVRLHLVGTKSSRDGFNAVVTARIGDRESVFQIIQSAGYLSTSETELQIATGSQNMVTEISVRWLSGLVQNTGAIPAGSMVTLIEGRPAEVSGP